METVKTIGKIALISFTCNILLLVFYINALNLGFGGAALIIFIVVLTLTSFTVLNIMPKKKKKTPSSVYLLYTGNYLLKLGFIASAMNILVDFIALIKVYLVYENGKLVFLCNLFFGLFINYVVIINGVSRVYIKSSQLGIKKRVIFMLTWWVPLVNIKPWYVIYFVTRKEYKLEYEKEIKNRARRNNKVCATKYPILLVHGVFFRDSNYFNYWGRIPDELEANGANIYYGNQQSADSIANNAEEIAQQIKTILRESGSEKVNIIGHSKGGLDSRHAVSLLGMDKYVASLTTINTPHYGCEFAEYLLDKMPEAMLSKIANTYNTTLKELGDHSPDLILAAEDLTKSSCEAFNKTALNKPGVMYQSAGSVLIDTHGGKFPLNLTAKFVRYFDGQNDGLVSLNAMQWGERFIKVDSNKKRGISHADMTDLYRENIDYFDVREFYVDLVSDLKNRGF